MSNQFLDETLKNKRSAGQNIVVPYIMAGDGGLDILEERLIFLEESGAAAVELGIPFSDPTADGPTIQDAGQRSLKNGTTLKGVLEALETFKEKRSIPVILMTYINPVFAYGPDKFAADCVTAGVNGVIIPDLPLEEESLIADSLKQHSISNIRLAAMTSPDERLTEIARRTEGFLYAVSVKGTTGARTSHGSNVQAYLQNLQGMTDTPVLAGFGVSTPEQAQDLSASCGGVIIGSRIVDWFHKGQTNEIKQLIQNSVKTNPADTTSSQRSETGSQS
ncbi:tryptophan synthase subunit alpha [Lentibacillus amyloliquefaciens]|uniref:Tryptophan synthase alpha chain n=1 Tax=Lentibacillus amyloliquefaciens TaxID=1472767 RepID=A0A0U3WH84_9BACI|nr:tryptophan synthase subunit alpha [Lentibacillus amyloliquefaciens]ALX49231.1 tryptophan synthase subunit alpha [Lentibacillus amyloliquefaciens]